MRARRRVPALVVVQTLEDSCPGCRWCRARPAERGDDRHRIRAARERQARGSCRARLRPHRCNTTCNTSLSQHHTRHLRRSRTWHADKRARYTRRASPRAAARPATGASQRQRARCRSDTGSGSGPRRTSLPVRAALPGPPAPRTPAFFLLTRLAPQAPAPTTPRRCRARSTPSRCSPRASAGVRASTRMVGLPAKKSVSRTAAPAPAGAFRAVRSRRRRSGQHAHLAVQLRAQPQGQGQAGGRNTAAGARPQVLVGHAAHSRAGAGAGRREGQGQGAARRGTESACRPPALRPRRGAGLKGTPAKALNQSGAVTVPRSGPQRRAGARSHAMSGASRDARASRAAPAGARVHP
jgi:hypothetical protein